MWQDVIQLVNEEYTLNEYGVRERSETTSQVYCEVTSATNQEWFDGTRNDLNPEYRFVVFYGDYDGQKVCIYQNMRYGIYRTYRIGKYIELYAERKSGA